MTMADMRQSLIFATLAYHSLEEERDNLRAVNSALLAALRVALNEVHHPGACEHERGTDIADFLSAAIAKAEGR